jgi:hypothetical protein
MRKKEKEMEGVKRISSSPLCVSVSFKILSENRWNMSAGYYISESQTEKLKKKIERVTSLQDVFLFVSTVLKDGSFYFGTCKTGQ